MQLRRKDEKRLCWIWERKRMIERVRRRGIVALRYK